MNRPKKFIQYDIFKLVIAIILLMLILLMWGKSPVSTKTASTSPTTVSSIVENTANAPTLQDAAASATPEQTESATVEIITPTEEAQTAATQLPPFPTPEENYSFSKADDSLVNLSGQPVYQLSADGSMWIPIVPQDLASSASQPTFVEPNSWLLMSNGVSYSWDPIIATWVSDSVEVESPTAAESAIEETTTPQECAAAPTQLTVGIQARVASNLNLRQSPNIATDNRILTMPVGSTVDILAAPVCTPYQNGAYLWWEVAMQDGTQGWAAEASLTQSNYFLTPIEN